ncbi:hypothetical protein HAX54_052996 [Datura stramonium]|uniref:Uncharacterized protein n=1 Tax=Datura stramonium TaxID=4076 RepID=A0ABS8T0T4_DATST|nr:hypothetical protein [Datura stramonium]
MDRNEVTNKRRKDNGNNGAKQEGLSASKDTLTVQNKFAALHEGEEENNVGQEGRQDNKKSDNVENLMEKQKDIKEIKGVTDRRKQDTGQIARKGNTWEKEHNDSFGSNSEIEGGKVHTGLGDLNEHNNRKGESGMASNSGRNMGDTRTEADTKNAVVMGQENTTQVEEVPRIDAEHDKGGSEGLG